MVLRQQTYQKPIRLTLYFVSTHSSSSILLQVLSSGQCGCQGYDLSQGDDYEQIYNSMTEMSNLIGDFDVDTKRQVVAALCSTPMNDGDHLQASDPGFL